MARTKSKRKSKPKAKTAVDKAQNRRIAKMERAFDTSKKQLDTYYGFRGIYQPAGNPAAAAPLGVASVSLLEGIGPAEINVPAGTVQEANSKKNREDTKIEIENMALQLRLYANNSASASNIQEVYVAVIRSKNYQPYSFGQPANLAPTGNPFTGVVGHIDNLLLEITNSNPTVGPGAGGFSPSGAGFSTIIGNAPPNEAFGPTQFMRPMWATESKYHYEVLYAKKHKLVKETDGSNRFGFIGFKDININLKSKVKGLKISYAQGASVSSSNAYDVNENNIYLAMWSDQTTNVPSADVASRVKWYD